jgi:hypothetical protein
MEENKLNAPIDMLIKKILFWALMSMSTVFILNAIIPQQTLNEFTKNPNFLYIFFFMGLWWSSLILIFVGSILGTIRGIVIFKKYRFSLLLKKEAIYLWCSISVLLLIICILLMYLLL